MPDNPFDQFDTSADTVDKMTPAVIKAESGGNPKAVSPTNAQGLMQLEPGTAKEMGVKDTFNPEENKAGGQKYLKQLLDKYKDPKTALIAYNWGPGNVDKHGVEKAPASSKAYADKILSASDVKATNPFDKFDTKEAPPAKPKVEATPAAPPNKDKDYAAGSPEKATFGESLRDVGQAALSLGSGLVGSAAGLAAETGAAAFSPISDPKKLGGLGVDPLKLKNDIASALTYEPKTAGAKALTDIASTPGRILSKPGEALVEAAPKELKPAADIAYQATLGSLPGVMGEAVRRPLTGSQTARTAAQQNLAAFRREGIEPTVGQVSEGGLTQEAGATKKTIESQNKQLAAKADQVATRASQVKTPEEAGKVIREAIGGTPETKSIASRKGATPQEYETGKKIGGYIDNARQIEGSLYDDMYKKVGRDTKFQYPNLFKTLDDMTSQNPNLMATSGGFVNRGILDLRSRLVDDAGAAKQLGYEDARWLRSKIGELTDPRQIVPGDTSKVSITPHQADALYAAMSEDMMAGVAKKGPRAEIATLKANQFTRQLHQEISNHLQPVMNSKLLKDVYDNATSGTKEGHERVATTWKTLDPFQKDAVKSVFFRELGREGENWSSSKFFNNYSKMSADAKNTMFGGPGRAKFRNDLDAMSKVAEKLSVDENTWHKLKSFLLTGGKLGTIAGTGAVAGLVSHSVIPVFLAGPALGYLTGTLVRNPKFVDWFVKSGNKVKPSSIPFLLANLKDRQKDMSQEDKEATDDYIAKIQSQMTPDSGVPK
jgi:hypothetical protein